MCEHAIKVVTLHDRLPQIPRNSQASMYHVYARLSHASLEHAGCLTYRVQANKLAEHDPAGGGGGGYYPGGFPLVM